ncbi:DUF2442 domain-containing protein [Salinarimonas rosea]|uniref:DUF2442 domain-containing protein n=1 Tax=Salinarimonas rosea TaxID=552063 RepID=UPI00041A9D74|nr:DUF2442 domain-containing protein [Salinarimonas rosea]
MAISDEDYAAATRWGEEQRTAGYAVRATYDPVGQCVVVTLSTGAVMRIDPASTRALRDAVPGDLADIEISGAGLVLFWPRLDEGVSLAVMRERFPPERAGAEDAARHY